MSYPKSSVPFLWVFQVLKSLPEIYVTVDGLLKLKVCVAGRIVRILNSGVLFGVSGFVGLVGLDGLLGVVGVSVVGVVGFEGVLE